MRGVFSEAIAENMHLPLCNLIKGTDLDPLDERTGQQIVRDVTVCRKGIMIRYGFICIRLSLARLRICATVSEESLQTLCM